MTSIYIEEGEVLPFLYHIDTEQFGTFRITSAFCYWDGEMCLLMDVGTSDNVSKILRFVQKKLHVPPKKCKGIVLTHYHFDHGGGSYRLWKRMSKKNPDFRIYTTELTKEKLQHPEDHLRGARTTFGDFVGTMKPLPDEAFEIVSTDSPLPLDLSENTVIKLIATPGHCKDHVSPLIIKDNRNMFLFAGEAAGTLFHGSKILSLPTSMPPNFEYQVYMESLSKIISLEPESIGFCHFGMITDKQDVKRYLLEHKTFMQEWRKKVIELFEEKSSTSYVLKSTWDIWMERVDPYYLSSPFGKKMFQNLHLALTYGMLVDLGYRAPKYEK